MHYVREAQSAACGGRRGRGAVVWCGFHLIHVASGPPTPQVFLLAQRVKTASPSEGSSASDPSSLSSSMAPASL